MANEFYYPWYPAHYRRDAGHLDHVADSCYRRLLDWYMESGEPIKKDAAKLMHIMSVSAPQFQAVWPQIEGFFTLSPDGYLHHKRCNIELDRQDTLVKHKSLGGLRSAAKRKAQKEQYQLLINSSSTAVQQQSDADPTALPPREGKVSKDIQSYKNSSGAETPPSPSLKSVLFGECLKWLSQKNGGKSPDEYRTIIGKWISKHGDAVVLDAFVRAQKGDPQGNPVAYVQSILGGSNGKRLNPDEQLSPGAAAARLFAEARSRSGTGGDGDGL